MSTQLISQIKAFVIDPNLSGEKFKLLARESDFDISRNFLQSEHLELIQDVTAKLLKQSESYLKTLLSIDSTRVLLPSEQEEISRIIKEKIVETCHLNKNSYGGYSTGSTFWPWIWSLATWSTQAQPTTKS